MPNLLDNEHERENDGGEENEGEQGERQQEYFYKKRDKAIKIAFKIISILAIMLACTCYFMAFLLCTYLMNAIHKESTQNILHTNSHIDIENLFPL